MSTKITIIEVNLGTDIDEIISEGVEELTGAAKHELDRAIQLAKQRDELRDKKDASKKESTNAITAAMNHAHQRLATAGVDGVICSDIMDIVGEHVPSSSAFALRMKKILRENGNLYSLERKKIKGNQHYVFSPFNQENDENDEA